MRRWRPVQKKAVERFHTLSEELRQTEAELEKTTGLMAATVDYAKTRPVFDGYKAARYSKKYLSEHEAELAAYRAARATMNELLDGAKLPKMADMKKARQELAGKKKSPLCGIPQGPGRYAAGCGGQGEH